jgi:DNA repair protein RadC
LDHYGSLSKVLEASPAELQTLPEIGPGVAQYLSLLMSVIRYYQVHRTQGAEIVNTVTKCGEYLIPYFCGRRNETVFLLCLDAKCKVLCCKEVGEGSVNSAAVPIRRIVERALGANATSVVIAHNHPSGVAVPSDEDKHATYRLGMALSAVEITLVDHIVVADDDFVSMVQSGQYRPEDCRVPI